MNPELTSLRVMPHFDPNVVGDRAMHNALDFCLTKPNLPTDAKWLLLYLARGCDIRTACSLFWGRLDGKIAAGHLARVHVLAAGSGVAVEWRPRCPSNRSRPPMRIPRYPPTSHG